MPAAARLGDKSSHGGKIITGSPTVQVDGLPAVRLNDLHSCPLPGHGVTALISTPAEMTQIEGLPAVTTGAIAGCGAIVTFGSPNVEFD